ncbi:caspase b isoform X2 [Paramisgurnus dabryanus]|uniref:caspase b isoform X2 n=1 Tax=Paramisgurnus dabryanus TaxID=90735 RepID=UPI0031F3C475
MPTTKTVILDALEDLLDAEFKDFKWHLCNQENNPVSRGKLEKANCCDVVDILVQHYSASDAGKIAVRALRNIKQNELAIQLKGKLQEVSEEASEEASSAGVPAKASGVSVSINATDGGKVKAPVLQGGTFNGPITFN